MSYPSDLKDTQWKLTKDRFAFRKYGCRASHKKKTPYNLSILFHKDRIPVVVTSQKFLEYGPQFLLAHEQERDLIKHVKGRKRHSTDTVGHMLHISVHAANIHDNLA